MNPANKLTVSRCIAVPFFVIFMLLSTGGGQISEVCTSGDAGFGFWRIISAIVFIAACLTDLLDGFIARKYKLITDFGKFMDPLADKLLVCSALILFCAEGSLDAWVVIIIISREFIISGFRLVAAEKGIVIAASMWGKVKTVFQMILSLVLILPGLAEFAGDIVMWTLIAIVVALTLISLVDYVYKNISVITGGGI